MHTQLLSPLYLYLPDSWLPPFTHLSAVHGWVGGWVGGVPTLAVIVATIFEPTNVSCRTFPVARTAELFAIVRLAVGFRKKKRKTQNMTELVVFPPKVCFLEEEEEHLALRVHSLGEGLLMLQGPPAHHFSNSPAPSQTMQAC